MGNCGTKKYRKSPVHPAKPLTYDGAVFRIQRWARKILAEYKAIEDRKWKVCVIYSFHIAIV